MQFGKFVNHIGTKIIYSIFEGKEINEYNFTITATPGKKLTDQIVEIQEAFDGFLLRHNLQRNNILFQRIFASDISNQAEELKAISFCPAVSFIQQPPLNGAKISTWIVLLEQVKGNLIEITSGEKEVVLKHNNYSHGFLSHMHVANLEGSFSQTKAIFNNYIEWLKRENQTLADNCLRTWIFVRDIDNNYDGMVKARNEVFTSEGLTPATHFIASTGIEGQTQFVSTLVMMDAYSIGGLEPGQITHLEALENLSRTHDYGVAFERGTAIDYGDRRHIFISGTASIDCHGDILFMNDIDQQTERIFDNIKALLHQAEADMTDVNAMIVYLRDRADTLFIEAYLTTNYPEIPTLLVLAPVCRSGWLIEIECTAIKAIEDTRFRNF
jgi:enamine deaminase RidA (YjgF/YER057c/UK114 family)